MDLDVLSAAPRLSEAAALAREAEELGFSRIWFSETEHNPYLASAAAAPSARLIGFGTAIAVAFPRSPMVTAQIAWDMAEATQGRFVLGLGTQVKAHNERRFSVPFARPAAWLREYVRALQAIFRAFQGEAPLKFEGEFYQFSLLTDFFSPGPIDWPNVPVYIAGVNTGLARVAGEVCQGFHVHPIHSKRYLKEVIRPAITEGAALTGRPADEVALAVPVFTIVGDDDQELEAQREVVRQQLAFYGSTPTYRAVFELHGWGEVADELRGLVKQGDPALLGRVVTDEMLETYAVTASWDTLAQALLDRYRGLATHVFPYHGCGDWRRSPKRAEQWRAVAAAVRAG